MIKCLPYCFCKNKNDNITENTTDDLTEKKEFGSYIHHDYRDYTVHLNSDEKVHIYHFLPKKLQLSQTMNS